MGAELFPYGRGLGSGMPAEWGVLPPERAGWRGWVTPDRAGWAERDVWSKNGKPPEGVPRGAQESATTYFPAEQYHRRLRLNCCVRDGNRCDPKPMITDKTRHPVSRVWDVIWHVTSSRRPVRDARGG